MFSLSTRICLCTLLFCDTGFASATSSPLTAADSVAPILFSLAVRSFMGAQAVSAELDELAQTAPPGRESHLGETEHDADYQQKSQKASAPSASDAKHAKSPSAAAAQHPKPARKSAARKVKTDKADRKGDDRGESAEESTDSEKRHKTQKQAGTNDSLLNSHTTLSWPKRLPRKK